jgi:HD-like signal output (HDOD) protein
MRPSEEEIYLAGLLHDIGYLVLDYVDPELSNRFHHRLAAEDISATELEVEMLELSHGEMGALLAEHWGLTPNIIAVMRYHHSEQVPNDATGQPLIAMTSLAESIVSAFGLKEMHPREAEAKHWHALGIADDQIEEVSDEMRKCAEEAARSLA